MKTFKTPEYQRNAYKNYISRNKENPEFKAKLKEQQKEYYTKNRELILQTKKLQYQEKKKLKEEKNLEIQ